MSEKNSGMKFYISIVISIIALILSILSVFKDKIFPFELKVLSGELAIVATKKVSNNMPLVFLISFINSGYSDGIVESVFVKVTDSEGNMKLYIPVVEIDLIKLLRGKKRLNIDNIRDFFSPFPIPSKQSLRKCIVFSQELKSDEYPFSDKWIPGKHRFELYLRASGWEKAKKVGEFEQVITNEAIEDYFKRRKGTFWIHPLLEPY